MCCFSSTSNVSEVQTPYGRIKHLKVSHKAVEPWNLGQWNLVNTNTVKAKYLLNRNHFEIPRHYNTNTTSYCYSEIEHFLMVPWSSY